MAALLLSAIGKRFSHLLNGFSSRFPAFWPSGFLPFGQLISGSGAFEATAAIYYPAGTCCLIAKATRNGTSPFRREVTMMRLHSEKVGHSCYESDYKLI